MSTGAMASLLSQQPFTFHGLTTIGQIFFLLDVAVFVLFSSLITVRFLMKPRALVPSLHHPSESFFFGSWWVSLALVLYGIQVYGIPGLGQDDDGATGWLMNAMRVLFWVYLACALLVAIFQYNIIFRAEHLEPTDAVPAWVLPAYPFLISGPLAAAVAKTQVSDSALQIVIGGVAGQGLGWTLSVLIYTVYVTRLIQSDLPDPGSRPGMYVSVGPAAYTAAGFVVLGKAAQESTPPGYLGITSLDVGDVWLGVAVPGALFLWLVAVWFCGVSTLSVLQGARRMHFTLDWWAMIFPNAGLAIATIQIGNVLASDPVRWAGSVLTILLVPLWIVCAVLHARAVWTRQLLFPGRDPGVDHVNAQHDRLKQSEAL